MKRLVLEILAAIALTLAAILASANGVSAGELAVTDAFARASATPVAKAGAAYVTITNLGAAADRLLAVSTPAAATAEVHATAAQGDAMTMDAAGPLDVPPDGSLVMKPGGYHIMLMGLSAPLKEGQTIELMLSFEKAGTLGVRVPVRGVAAEAP